MSDQTNHSLIPREVAPVALFSSEDEEDSADDDARREGDSVQQALGQDGRRLGSRRSLHRFAVDGVDSERLRRRTVHDDVDEEDLHRVERVREPERGREGDEGQGCDGRRELETEEVLDVDEDAYVAQSGFPSACSAWAPCGG